MGRSVRGELQFLGVCEGKPVAYGRQRDRDNLPLVARGVSIVDARALNTTFQLDLQGFMLLRHVTAMRDFLDNEERQAVYLPELEQLVRALTGAEKAVALNSSVVRRSERSDSFLQAGTTLPGRFVHCDYSSGHMGSLYWLESALGPDEAAWRRRRRFAIYNVWRALSPPPQDTPLALCDARSVRPEDCVPADCVCDPEDAPEWRFENSLYRYGAHQRWVYFPEMQLDEVLVFKGYDSDSARAGGVPHAAFDDPSCPKGAPARESIDERVIAFF